MQFAAGQLANALGLMVSCHLENCAECRRQTAVYDQLGGEIFDTLEPIKVDPELINKTLRKLDVAEHPDATTQTMTDPQLPKPLQRFVPNTFDKLPWTGIVRSIQEYSLPISDERYNAKLLKIAAGKELPVHTHRGNEYTFIMQGSFSDSAGDYHTGDFILANTDIIHQPRAHNDIDCICFAVLDAPLKMTGFWGRMLNPFLS